MKQMDLQKVDGISYTVYRKKGDKAWSVFVRPNDGEYTHRDFMLETIRGGATEFSSCGILLYDGTNWFATFSTSYKTKCSMQERQRDLNYAKTKAQAVFGKDKVMMAHLTAVAVDKISHQKEELKKIGLTDEQIQFYLHHKKAKQAMA